MTIQEIFQCVDIGQPYLFLYEDVFKKYMKLEGINNWESEAKDQDTDQETGNSESALREDQK